MSSDPCHVLVTGDVVLDRHIYEGGRSALQDRSTPGTRIVEEVGGAALTHRLIEAVFQADFDERLRAWDAAVLKADSENRKHPEAPKQLVSRLGLTWSPDLSSWPEHLAGSAWFSAMTKPGTKDRFWRVSRAFGYGSEPGLDASQTTPAASAAESAAGSLTATESPSSRPAILVLDEAGDRFRRQESEALWHLPEKEPTGPDWIVLKLAGPIGTGDLWDRLMRCEPERRLIVLVSARLLRQNNVRLSRGLSWERTVEQLRKALAGNPVLRPLRRARHLIVSFEGDGAVWIDSSPSAQPDARLIFDAEHAEGEWGEQIEGKVFGYQSCLAASVAYTLAAALESKAEPDLHSAIERGLAAMRNLQANGHGPAVSEKGVWGPIKGFPVDALASEILHPACRFARAPVPWGAPGPDPWSILASLQNPLAPNRPLHGFARQLAIRGETVIEHAPHFHLGKLLTLDRDEMETLRSLRRVLLSYRDTKSARKPLSIGVFGRPGSGKSFAVEQLALGVFGDQGKKSWDGLIEFNLSQFKDTKDLIGAFHQVRDRVLQGMVPVVFWDEFDSKNYHWLQFLLAPMQDGRFQEDQITHTLGKCVFVFAGGTAETFETFGVQQGELDLKLLKVPDFKSRFDGTLNVVGPNLLNNSDIFFPIRRALMIRNLLGCDRNEKLVIDAGLLTALLEFPTYEHGARSLGKVLDPFIAARKVPQAPLRRSQLPAPNQLSLHVKDAEAFHALCERDLAFKRDEVVEKLAPAIHETFCELTGSEGLPFDKLDADLRRSNEAAARRIPDILALVGLRVVPGTATSEDEDLVKAHLNRHLELLAEEEHKGWMAQRESEGWRFAETRNDKNRLHDCLRPFHALREADKEKDRNSVRHFPDFVRRTEFKIEFG